MSFALGRDARQRVISNISNLRTFVHGGISASRGPCRDLKALPPQYRLGLDSAAYVVYCYSTPIAWVTFEDPEDETSRRTNWLPDWQYSANTTYHQSLAWEAWGGKVTDPAPRYSREENRGTSRGRTSDKRYNRIRQDGMLRPGTDFTRAMDADSWFRGDGVQQAGSGYRHPSHP
jgi:hypothetical protein